MSLRVAFNLFLVGYTMKNNRGQQLGVQVTFLPFRAILPNNLSEYVLKTSLLKRNSV